jgi:fibronectin type 3 domain-containing protein
VIRFLPSSPQLHKRLPKTGSNRGRLAVVPILRSLLSCALLLTMSAAAWAAPPTPTGVSAAAGNASVTIAWNASSGATSYVVKKKQNTGAYVTAGTPTSSPYVASGLTNGVTYYFKVAAVNGTGTSADSAEVSAVPTMPAPTGLAAALSGTQATLTWNASSGATGYKLQRSDSFHGWTTVATPTTTTFTNTGLTGGWTYFYKVAATTASTVGADSANVTVYPLVPTLTGLSATAGGGQVSLSWNSYGEQIGYRIKCGTSAGNYTLTQTTDRWHNYMTWTGLTPGTTYYFVVQGLAQHSNGDGLFTSPVSATPTLPAPIGLAATPDNAQVSLSWTSTSGATSYKVKRATASGGPYTTVATPTSNAYVNTGLANGTAYYYVVSAVQGASESANSGQVTSTPQQTAPNAPGSPLISNVTSGSLRATAPILPPGATSLTLQKKLLGTSDTTYASVATGLAALAVSDVTGLSPATGYSLRYLAVNSGGSIAGAYVDATTLPDAPAAPSALTALAGDGQVALTWTGASGAVTYRVERGTATGGAYTLVADALTTLTYTDTAVANGTAYYYVVSGVNTGGIGALSNEASATPQEAAPAAPSAPTIGEIAATQLKAMAPALPARADTLTLQKKLASEPDTSYANVATGLAAASQTTVTGLSAETQYAFRYLAVGDGGSTAGASATATTLPNAPSAPQNVTAAAGDGQVALGWSASAGAASYTVKRATVEGGPYALIEDGIAVTSYQDTSVTNGTTYYYVVNATNAGGQSADSNQVSATPQIPAPAVPGAITFDDVTATGLSAQLPVLPTRASTFSLQKKLGIEADSAYATIAQNIGSEANVPVTGLVAATAYTFRAVAVGAGGTTSGAGAEVTTLPNAPSAPGAPAIGQIAQTQLVATAPALPASALTLTLQKKLATTGDEAYSTVANGLTANEATPVTGLSPQTAYSFRYLAVNAGGTTPGAATDATTLPNAPDAPQNLAAQGEDAKVELSWSASTGATGYQVKRSATDGGPYTVIAAAVTAPSYTDQTVSNGTTYFYVVAAFNGGGQSANSSQASATPQQPAPGAPVLPAISQVASDSLRVTAPSLPERAVTLSLQKKGAAQDQNSYVTIATGLAAGAQTTVTGLAPETAYAFRYLAVGVGGETAGAEVEATTLVEAPIAPAGLSAAGSDAQVQLSWTASARADSYQIKRATATGGPYTILIESQAGTTYADTAVNNGTAYYYVVIAHNAGGSSAPSEEASATPQEPAPVAPGAPVVSGIAIHQVLVTAPALPAHAASLTLQKKSAAAADSAYADVATGLAAGAQTTVTGLDAASSYAFRYVAVGAGGNTAGSAVQATTLPEPPSAPSGLLATAGDGQVSLSWTATAGADSYTLKRKSGAGPWSVVAPSLTSPAYLDTGLTNGTTYTYVVLAANAGGQSGASDEASATPQIPAPTTPAAPSFADLAATTLTANLPALPARASSLTLQRRLDGENEATYVTVAAGLLGEAEYAVTGLSAGTRYEFRLVAVGAGGSTAGPASAVTTLPLAPETPVSLVAQAGDGQVTLTWIASSDATSYHVMRSTTEGGESVSVGTTTDGSYLDTDVDNGTAYYYTVIALNAGGSSGPSNEAGATPQPPVPGAPLNLSATVTNDQVQLSWTGSVGATSYQVLRSATAGTGYGEPRVTAETSFTDATAGRGQTYYYLVKAVNGGGVSDASNEASATLRPGAPQGLTATAGDGQVALSWTASAGATGYTVKRGTQDGGPYTTLAESVTAGNYADTGVVSGTAYYYVVTASNGGGHSEPSNQASATAQAAQADWLIRNAGEAVYAGDNLYQAQATSQVKSQIVAAAGTAVYQVSVQNDAAWAATFTISGSAGQNGWSVRYFDALEGGVDITAQVTGAGGWSTAPLEPQGFRDLRVEVTAGETVAPGAGQEVLISAKSGEVVMDAAKLSTTRQSAPIRPDLTIQARLFDGENAESLDTETWETIVNNPIFGANIFNLTAAQQTAGKATFLHNSVRFEAKIRNTGTTGETYVIKAPAATPTQDGWTVKYYDLGGVTEGADEETAAGEITAQVTGESGWELSLPAGAEAARRILIVMTPSGDNALDSKAVLLKAVPRFASGNADEGDAVKALAEMQSIGLVEWTVDQGESWHPANGTGAQNAPAVVQNTVVGFRASRGNASLPWPDLPDYKPVWTVSGMASGEQTHIGDSVWVHFPTVSSQAVTVAAECGNQVAATVAGVVANYQVDIWSLADDLATGGGDGGTATITAYVTGSDGLPAAGRKVRFVSIFAGGDAAGILSVNGIAGDTATTDEDGYARITLTSGAQTGTALITATLLDAQLNAVKSSDALGMPFHAAP